MANGCNSGGRSQAGIKNHWGDINRERVPDLLAFIAELKDRDPVDMTINSIVY